MREIESVEALREAVTDGRTSLRGLRIQGVDLAAVATELSGLAGAGGVLLGCPAPPHLVHHLVRTGALVFPIVPGLPFDPYRVRLYTADELYAGVDEGYPATSDGAGYDWYKAAIAAHDVFATLLMALHDHAVDDALAAHLTDETRVVGVMGGHALRRDDDEYAHAAVLGRTLTRSGRLVATGGGPGAMEAANLGAWLAPHPDDALAGALDLLAGTPVFADDVVAWVGAALKVRAAWPGGGASTGIPTWHYGHEPPNAFSTHIAKYFRNAVREDVLLRVCRGGIVFLPGAAGTVQEIFADATDNYYDGAGGPAPMVLVGVDYWTRRLPAWPLLETLAAGRRMNASIALADSTDEAADLLLRSADRTR